MQILQSSFPISLHLLPHKNAISANRLICFRHKNVILITDVFKVGMQFS